MTHDWIRVKPDWELMIMKKEAIKARIFTISGYLVLAGCYAGFAVGPIIGVNIRLISNLTDYNERYLMVQSYHPYDHSQSPNYELTQASQLISGAFIGMAVSIPDNYFAALIYHSSAQFEVLGKNIEKFVCQDYEIFKGPRNNHFNNKLKFFVNRHVHLIS